MTVADNVGFGLRMRKVPGGEIKSRVERALEMVEITQFASRRPQQLSGGQRQRVALARALVNEPQVVLLDEPLSALDRKLRQNLQVELMRLQSRLGLTFIFVTHDQEEALTMSDRIAVMNKGQIEQLGTSEEMYERPATPFVAKFLGSSNLLNGTVLGPNRISTPIGELEVRDALPARGEVLVSIRPEKVQLSRSGFEHLPNQIRVKVTDEIYSGAENEYRLTCAGHIELSVEVMNSGLETHDFEPGEELVAHLPPERLVVLREASPMHNTELEGL
jgi:spermidine/putrescine transport system ATP-binding protein